MSHRSNPEPSHPAVPSVPEPAPPGRVGRKAVGSAPGSGVRAKTRGGRQVHVFHHSAGAVVIRSDSCLLLRRGEDWTIPKGHLEHGEQSRDAAVREVAEETGLSVNLVAELGSTRYQFGADRLQRKRVDWFLAVPVGGELGVEPGFDEARFVTRDQAARLLRYPADRELIVAAFAMMDQMDAAG